MTIAIQKKLTFVIPVRIDCNERERNLFTVIKWLSILQCRIIVLEADEIQHIESASLPEHVDYKFIQDNNPKFFRTHYINILLEMATTEVIAVWDSDIIVCHKAIKEAVKYISEGCTIAYPYDGRFIMLNDEGSEALINSMDIVSFNKKELTPIFKRPFCGGAFLVNKKRYRSIGGENERFTGWGLKMRKD